MSSTTLLHCGTAALHASKRCRMIAPVVLLAALGGGMGSVQASACGFDAAVARFESLLADAGLPGGAILVGARDGILLERYFGTYDAATRIPIASASKLLSGLRIAQLAERGQVDLGAPVSAVLPQFDGAASSMTLAQMFAHTSGYGDDSGSPLLFDRSLTLAEAVDQIACCVPMPAGWAPGEQFAYGGVSMHVGGRVAELADGGDWEADWRQHVGLPLGIGSIDWQAFGTTRNYGIAGSARSNLRDYGRVLHVLANGGWSHGVRIMHASTVAAMTQDFAAGLPVASAPKAAPPDLRYGLGHWIDRAATPQQAARISSLGAFGFFPFVDLDSGVFGVFMIRGTAGVNTLALPVYRQMQSDIDAQIPAEQCAPAEWFEFLSGDGFESPAVDLRPVAP